MKKLTTNQLIDNDNYAEFQQMLAIFKQSGIEIDQQSIAFLQPYLQGKESLDEAITRLESLQAELKNV